MSLTFGADSVPGTHENLIFEPWEYQRQQQTSFGLSGAVVLTGPRTVRTIIAPYWIHNSYGTSAALVAAIDYLHAGVGNVFILSEGGAVSRSFGYCEFEGFRQQFGPIYSPQLGWFAGGLLYWNQLGP